MEKRSGIYCIENLVNGKKYIGQSVELCIRMGKDHRESSALYGALNKYGEENFKRYIVLYCEGFELERLEIECIKIFHSHVSEHGYNISFGGNTPRRGLPHSIESRKKMMESQLGEKNHAFGKKRKNSASQYFGVYKRIEKRWAKIYIYWYVQITKKYIGQFKTELEAALAYDKYVIENNLPNPLNFPDADLNKNK